MYVRSNDNRCSSALYSVIETGSSVIRIACHLLQVLGEALKGYVIAAYWCCKQIRHFKRPPPFLFSFIPAFSSLNDYPGPFQELSATYQSIKNVQNLEKDINCQLKKGYCYAQCLGLVLLIQSQNSSLKDAIEQLKTIAPTLTFYQVLEIFRECFERHEEAELLVKVQEFLPQGNEEPICSELTSKNLLQSQFLTQYQSKDGLIVTSLFNEHVAHTILLEINRETTSFGLFDCNSGYYTYNCMEDLSKAFADYVDTHTNYFKSDSNGWIEFIFYPTFQT